MELQRRPITAIPVEGHLDIPIGDIDKWNTKEHYYIPIKVPGTAIMEPDMSFLKSDVSTMRLNSCSITREPASVEVSHDLSTPALRKRERTLKSLARESEKPSASAAPLWYSAFDGWTLQHLSQKWIDFLPICPSPLRQSFGPSNYEEEDDGSEHGYSKPTGSQIHHPPQSFEQTQFSEWEFDESFETEYMSMSYRPTVHRSDAQQRKDQEADERLTVTGSKGEQPKSIAENASQLERLTDQRARDAWWHENMTMAYPLSGIR
jgi:hypothetical protein